MYCRIGLFSACAYWDNSKTNALNSEGQNVDHTPNLNDIMDKINSDSYRCTTVRTDAYTVASSPNSLLQLFNIANRKSERRAWYAASQTSEHGRGGTAQATQLDVLNIEDCC